MLTLSIVRYNPINVDAKVQDRISILHRQLSSTV